MKKKFEILVVDDDLKNIQVGINFLKQNDNYHLVFATSGQQALERVKDRAFDLVLLDIIMPIMDGYEVCRRLKADPATRNIPVIFLTAKHEADSLMKGFDLGGADYITKPFNAPELHARVKTHLELHHYYRQEIAKLREVLACSQKAETVRFIAGGITHDCNNFITSISPSVQLLKGHLTNAGVDIGPYRDLLDGIDKAAAKVTDLLSTFGHFSLHTESAREIVDMNEVVADLRKVCRGALSHTVHLDIEFHSQPALVVANKLHVEQVLLNVLINAEHAIEERQRNDPEPGRIHIAIGEMAEDRAGTNRYLRITVADNGIGMTDEVRSQIFDKYFTTRKDTGGSGLGLAVCLDIVSSHKGRIEVESDAGRGTTFQILLPLHSE